MLAMLAMVAAPQRVGLASTRCSPPAHCAKLSTRKCRVYVVRAATPGDFPKPEPAGERIMRSIATATSSPLAQYIASPVTVLHSLDPRVKQVWLMALVVLSSRAHVVFRCGTVVFIILATLLCLPKRVWKDQLGRTIVITLMLFVSAALVADGIATPTQVRTPPPRIDALPPLPSSLSGYKYVLFKWGPIQLTRRGVALAGAASSLSFTVLQSASLCLATTTPEELAAALRWFMKPLSLFGVGLNEMTLGLLLSLRFVGLVFDEVRNIALGVVSRGVQWRSLKLRETIDCYVVLATRLFKNLLYHSEHIAEAMVARGYRGNPDRHTLYLLNHQHSFSLNDAIAVATLLLVLVAAGASEKLLL